MAAASIRSLAACAGPSCRTGHEHLLGFPLRSRRSWQQLRRAAAVPTAVVPALPTLPALPALPAFPTFPALHSRAAWHPVRGGGATAQQISAKIVHRATAAAARQPSKFQQNSEPCDGSGGATEQQISAK
jgi:hypothetical protein